MAGCQNVSGTATQEKISLKSATSECLDKACSFSQSESSLCEFLIAKGATLRHADDEDSENMARMRMLICLRLAHMLNVTFLILRFISFRYTETGYMYMLCYIICRASHPILL